MRHGALPVTKLFKIILGLIVLAIMFAVFLTAIVDTGEGNLLSQVAGGASSLVQTVTGFNMPSTGTGDNGGDTRGNDNGNDGDTGNNDGDTGNNEGGALEVIGFKVPMNVVAGNPTQFEVAPAGVMINDDKSGLDHITFTWTVDGEKVCEGKGPDHTVCSYTFENTGDHTVKVTVSDEEGESNSHEKTITVSDQNQNADTVDVSMYAFQAVPGRDDSTQLSYTVVGDDVRDSGDDRGYFLRLVGNGENYAGRHPKDITGQATGPGEQFEFTGTTAQRSFTTEFANVYETANDITYDTFSDYFKADLMYRREGSDVFVKTIQEWPNGLSSVPQQPDVTISSVSHNVRHECSGDEISVSIDASSNVDWWVATKARLIKENGDQSWQSGGQTMIQPGGSASFSKDTGGADDLNHGLQAYDGGYEVQLRVMHPNGNWYQVDSVSKSGSDVEDADGSCW